MKIVYMFTCLYTCLHIHLFICVCMYTWGKKGRDKNVYVAT